MIEWIPYGRSGKRATVSVRRVRSKKYLYAAAILRDELCDYFDGSNAEIGYDKENRRMYFKRVDYGTGRNVNRQRFTSKVWFSAYDWLNDFIGDHNAVYEPETGMYYIEAVKK